MKIRTSHTNISHPLEEVLDIEPCTTLVETHEVVPADVVEHVRYDDKDVEIELKIEEVYTAAMQYVQSAVDNVDMVEAKYKARVTETAAAMLNIALSAVREKRELKAHKDKLVTAPSGQNAKTINNNLVVADRNEIMKMIESGNIGQ